jgi:hypothetical protein
MIMRPVGTFAISHQLQNDGTIVPITGLAQGNIQNSFVYDPVIASPVCELGPKSSEELYWGKFCDIYILNYIYYMKQNFKSSKSS